MGFAVIQGYGLTETAPIVTLNHPFKSGKEGSVGTPIAGVEVRIADDGEILVRGENVTSRLLRRQVPTPNAKPKRCDRRGGWLHTGDIGERDDAGAPVHQGPQEGNDRHAGRAQRLSGRRRARAQRAAGRPRVSGRGRDERRRGARARGAGARARRRSARHRARREHAAPGSSADSRRVDLAGGGAAAHRRARASSNAPPSATGWRRAASRWRRPAATRSRR